MLYPPWLRNVSYWDHFSEYGVARSHWERDRRVRGLGDDRRGTAAQPAMCGSVGYRDVVTAVPAACLVASWEMYHAISAKLACRNDL
jgi:hypothetical protein